MAVLGDNRHWGEAFQTSRRNFRIIPILARCVHFWTVCKFNEAGDILMGGFFPLIQIIGSGTRMNARTMSGIDWTQVRYVAVTQILAGDAICIVLFAT
jgi:hypothetical protein